MKVKDLIKVNKDAEVKIVMPGHKVYTGKLSFGWMNETEDEDDPKTATELCIFLED